MTQEKLARLLRDKLTITGDGNVIGTDNTVTVIEQEAGNYAIQIGQLTVTLAAEELRRLLALPLPAVAPAPPAHFVGREPELARLKAALTQDGAPQAITALRGLGGIGKTALAKQLAAELDGQLPGGVFWADLPAHSGDPLPILAGWARLCGQDVSGMTTPDTRAQAVRGILARRVRERGGVLAVLDDVHPQWLACAQTLQAALPPGVPALITTREAEVARALRAQVVQLDTLAKGEARELLEALSEGALREVQADRVAELCGYLPLALGLAAGAAAEEGSDWLLRRLSAAATRLDTLELEGAERKEHSLRLTFQISYDGLARRHLETVRIFEQLAVFAPAPIAPARLAGVLAELSGGSPAGSGSDPAQVEAVDEHLRRLARWGLARREGMRYGLHPLLRDYAAERLARNAREYEALRSSHMAYFVKYAEKFTSEFDALEDQIVNLMIAARWSWETGEYDSVLQLAEWLYYSGGRFLDLRAHSKRAKELLEWAAAIGKQRGDEAMQGRHLRNLGIMLKKLGLHDEALEKFQLALAIQEKLSDRAEIAACLLGIGAMLSLRQRSEEAIEKFEKALAIQEELGDEVEVASCHMNIGIELRWLERYEEAHAMFEEAAVRFERHGESKRLAECLFNRGNCFFDQTENERAIECYEKSLSISREIEDLEGIATCRYQQGLVLMEQHAYPSALKHLQEALNISHKIDDMYGRVLAQEAIGEVYGHLGNHSTALQFLRKALEMSQELGYKALEEASRSFIESIERERGGGEGTGLSSERPS